MDQIQLNIEDLRSAEYCLEIFIYAEALRPSF
jgi:hypothetical protein